MSKKPIVLVNVAFPVEEAANLDALVGEECSNRSAVVRKAVKALYRSAFCVPAITRGQIAGSVAECAGGGAEEAAAGKNAGPQ